MKNLSKLTATFLAVILVLASMTVVHAADSATIANADKAATLKDLGLYAGTDATDPSVGLEYGLNTQDSLIFLAKLFGYTDAANKLTADEVAEGLAKFDDADSISEYAKNAVAYAAANGILSGSTKDGKFFVGAKDTVTSARFATFMLRQMGISVADWKKSAAQLATVKGSKVDSTLYGDLTRDAAVGVMYGVLTAEKASGKTVIADIIGDNADLEAKAQKAGLLTAELVQTKLSVVSVKALNCKQVEIVFNTELKKESAQRKGNYVIKDNGESFKTLTDSSCKLSDDMKTVTITLDSTVDDRLTNSSQAEIIISKEITAVNGEKLDKDIENTINVEDGLLPTVLEVKATGEKNIRITFSEPVYEGNNTDLLSTSNYGVKSGTYTYYITGAKLNLNVIDLKIGTRMIEGPVVVTVNNERKLKDYAGYSVFKSELAFDYVKDTSVPVITITKAENNVVVLHFSKPVIGSNIKLYHTAVNNEAGMTAATTNNDYVDDITFRFNNSLPIGALKLFLKNSIVNGEKIKDGYGISVPDQQLTYNVTDTSEPVITTGAANRTSDTEGTVEFYTNEAGSYYYSVVNKDETEPTVDTSGVGTACTSAEITVVNLTGLTAGVKDIYIRVKDAAGNVSNVVKILIPSYVAPYISPNADQSAPTDLTGVAPTTYSGSDGSITNVNTMMEYKLSTATDWTAVGGAEITGLTAGTYMVRLAAKPGFNSGASATVVVAEGPNADQAEPIGLMGYAPTTNGGPDGMIYTSNYYGVFEYKLVTAEEWITKTVEEGTEDITGLTAGEYMVRFAAKPGYNAGEAAIVVVPALGL
jgi:hypothetical protein